MLVALAALRMRAALAQRPGSPTPEARAAAARKISAWALLRGSGGLSAMWRFIEDKIHEKRAAAAVMRTFFEETARQLATGKGRMRCGVAKFIRSVRVIQRVARGFIAVRRMRRMLWDDQFVGFERRRNRALMRKWRNAWALTTREIARVLKLKGDQPGSPQRGRGRGRGPPPVTARWVGAVLDDFVASLPPEVKNVMEVPPEVYPPPPKADLSPATES